MRIASISKTITMAVLAKLWQEGKVDLEKDVYEYVPDFPRKTVEGREVRMTVRQLCCHMELLPFDWGLVKKDRKQLERMIEQAEQVRDIQDHYKTVAVQMLHQTIIQ